mgnify:CR=1 FL=1
MDKFVPKEYIEKFIQTNKSEKTQMEVFFEFISAQIFNNEEYTVEDFVYLNKNDLLESLKYYIKRNKVTAKGTAKAYLGYLGNFFKNLASYYQVDSDIFVNGNFSQSLWDEADEIISLLNDKEETNTNIATNEEYDNLVQKIKEAEQKYSFETAMSEIDKYVENGCSGKLEKFRLILSVCATQMLLEYGFANRTIIELKISNIDLESGIVKRGIYELPIPNSIKSNLKKYIKIRNYLLYKLEIMQDKLFIKYDGNAINGSEAADKLFGGVMGEDSSKASKPFARRCIQRMIDAGLNSKLIRELTGYKNDVYEKSCDYINENNVNNIQNKINEFIIPTQSRGVRKIGYVDCPMCGKKSIKAVANEFVLIRKPGDDFLYLACKECGEREKRKKFE